MAYAVSVSTEATWSAALPHAEPHAEGEVEQERRPPEQERGREPLREQGDHGPATMLDRAAQVAPQRAPEKRRVLAMERLVEAEAGSQGGGGLGRQGPVLVEPGQRIARGEAHQDEDERDGEQQGDRRPEEAAEQPPAHRPSRSSASSGRRLQRQASAQVDSARRRTRVNRRCTTIPATGAARKMTGWSAAMSRTASL